MLGVIKRPPEGEPEELGNGLKELGVIKRPPEGEPEELGNGLKELGVSSVCKPLSMFCRGVSVVALRLQACAATIPSPPVRPVYTGRRLGVPLCCKSERKPVSSQEIFVFFPTWDALWLHDCCRSLILRILAEGTYFSADSSLDIAPI